MQIAEGKNVDSEFIPNWLCLGLPKGADWAKDLSKHLIHTQGDGLLLIIDGLDEFTRRVPSKKHTPVCAADTPVSGEINNNSDESPRCLDRHLLLPRTELRQVLPSAGVLTGQQRPLFQKTNNRQNKTEAVFSINAEA